MMDNNWPPRTELQGRWSHSSYDNAGSCQGWGREGGCEGTKRTSLGRAAESGYVDLLQPAAQGLQGSSPWRGSLERTETSKRLCWIKLRGEIHHNTFLKWKLKLPPLSRGHYHRSQVPLSPSSSSTKLACPLLRTRQGTNTRQGYLGEQNPKDHKHIYQLYPAWVALTWGDHRYRDKGLTEHQLFAALGWPPPCTANLSHPEAHILNQPWNRCCFSPIPHLRSSNLPRRRIFLWRKMQQLFHSLDFGTAKCTVNCFSSKNKATVCLLILSQERFQRRKPRQSLSTFFSSFAGHAIQTKKTHYAKSFHELYRNWWWIIRGWDSRTWAAWLLKEPLK